MRNRSSLSPAPALTIWLTALFCLFASAMFSQVQAATHSAVAIVSDRSAPVMAAGAYRFLEDHPDASIQIRSVAQVNEMDDAALEALISPAATLIYAGVFGAPVERLLALPVQSDQQRLVFHSDRRLYDLHKDAEGGRFTGLDAETKEKLFSRPPTDQPFPEWLAQQKQALPHFNHWLDARSYWQNRNAGNIHALWQLLLDPSAEPAAARVNAPVRAYLNTRPVELEELAAAMEDRDTLFVLDHQSGDLPGNWSLHRKLCSQSELQCVTLLAAWGAGSEEAIEQIQALAPKQSAWAILSVQDFVIGGGEGREAVSARLSELNVPVFKGIRVDEYNADSYALSANGLPADSVYYRVAMPELQGIGQPEVLALSTPAKVDEVTGARLILSQPIDKAVERILGRIQHWLALQRKDNADKRVAIVYYNHPPGRHNIGADNLNVPESLWQILNALKDQGYATGTLPQSPEALLDLLQERGVNLPEDRHALEQMAPLVKGVSSEDYRQWFATLPETVQQEMVRGPLGYLHTRLKPLLSSNRAQPIDPGVHQEMATLIQRSLGDLRHALDGVRDQRRSRALDLLDQLKDSYTVLLGDDLADEQRINQWQNAGELVTALVHMGIEGMRGWGEAPGRSMIWQDRMLLPGLQFGNIFVGPQPPRGWELNEELLHANMTFPPPHQYLGFYHYLRDDFKADALIHLGRHSTYEFLPRRSVGLGEDDYPSLVLGDLPSIYPYIVDGVGEGIQAKRRGKAVIIDHLTPPLAVTELYDDLLSVRQLIESAEAASDPVTRRRAVEDLRERIDSLGLREELIASMDEELKVRGIGFDQVDDEFLLHEVGHYLTKLQEAFMPLGLHTFGRQWEPDAIDTMLSSMADSDNIKPQWRDNLTRSPQLEMDALINALNGGFVAPGKGNDPIKTPEALPTGRNFHALDGSLLPTPLGFKLGAELAADARSKPMTEAERRKKEAVILWASDAVRDEGAMIGFGFDMLGVTPVWNSRGIIKGLKLIPLDQSRPRRHDVLFTTSGLFRDLYGRQLKWLDEAVLLSLAASEETIRRDYPALDSALTGALEPLTEYTAGNETLEQNLIAANWVEEARLMLRNPTASASELGRQASLRVFGSAPGAYGAGVNRLVERSGSWQQRQELGQAYIARLGHAYGMSLDGLSAQDHFSNQLSQVGRSYLGRASHLYGLIDNNDAFDYLGGLNLAVETVTGAPPTSYVIQHADADNARLDPLAQALGSELRGRFLNPQWIKPLMDEGYSGARTMGSEFIEYLWGWQVTSPEIIQSRVWDEVKAVYLDDRFELGLDEFLREGHNQQVLTNIQAVMLVAAEKGFWQTDDETLNQLSRDFARSIIEHGIPGSGHTHPDHPVYQFVMPKLDADSAQALQQLQANSRMPETEWKTDSEPSHIREISLQDQQASEPDSTDAEAADNSDNTQAQSSNTLELSVLIALALLIMFAGLLRGRMGGKR
ncbi:cobaltochelatase subunit CobN [Marinobacterium mangrovicola]|uniref:Cobaltochelatase CobN subunit n=1 Tax=Marinobacterium mangrovicola TaxID=1476959 RepID=A0A4V2PEA1_9GAMM|nr:cobaltochelatase subunit CobN [Marinobacterium mangrovicola]TCK08246.1 cobaltochelatase CobN subunit [Marinobacterium mangrovicola]